MTRRWKSEAIPVLILGTASLLFSLMMLFFPLACPSFGHDAGLFAYIGFAVTKGRSLYTGAWDNKGPLLYLIDALGVAIHYRYGIYLLELASLFTTLLFLYRTAKLRTSRYTALVCVLTAAMPLTMVLEGGNLSEEWAMPFTAIGMYYIVKYFRDGFQLRRWQMMLVGACISAVFLLRLNILAQLGVAVLGVILALTRRKRFKELGEVFLFALLGFSMFLTPFIIYLARTGALKACVDSAYLGALGAFEPISPHEWMKNVTEMLLHFAPSGGFFLLFATLLAFPFCARGEKNGNDNWRAVQWIGYFGLLATLAANALSGAMHMHYFMSFVPALLIPVVGWADELRRFVLKNHGNRFGAVAAVALAALLVCQGGFQNYRLCVLENIHGEHTYVNAPYTRVSRFIEQNTTPEDTVELIGDASAVTSYYRAKRLAASNHFYYANGRFSDAMLSAFANDISADVQANLPKIILFTDQEVFGNFTDHLDDGAAFAAFLDAQYEIYANPSDNIVYMLRGTLPQQAE